MTYQQVKDLKIGDVLEVWIHPQVMYGHVELVTVEIVEPLPGTAMAIGYAHMKAQGYEGNSLQHYSVLSGTHTYRIPAEPAKLPHQK